MRLITKRVILQLVVETSPVVVVICLVITNPVNLNTKDRRKNENSRDQL